ncbi:dynamin family protein [Butyrivibrio sp. VCB2001]|uniref:dynamin family protein n=1 Tax=Butyrivibrio sp. VCB2001 TaxID=1280667 RepID=UPI00041C525E|nr:dynamin family protein [Butyrivibrio sp. VCB2001]
MGEMNSELSERLLSGLREFKGFYTQDYYYEFEDRITGIASQIEESRRKGRLLKIGIVGEVKAGKSSFLNALLFDGEDILPKASTPMTAALTKITYSETQSAKIVFYSENEWEKIKMLSHEYDESFEAMYVDYCKKHEEQQARLQMNSMENVGFYNYQPPKTKEEMKISFDKRIPLKQKACKELVVMAESKKIGINELLGKEPTIEIRNMQQELQDYIGVDGKYTPIVKHVELEMNNEVLKDIEIVDTPGLNDPIVSRSEKTKTFLRDCDVVFLLSYCGEFLTQDDISFMCETLPNEGVENIIIVGSKFDSGILDDNKSTDYRMAAKSSARIYREQAENNINRCINGGYRNETVIKIKESLPPCFVSSVLFSCAVKKKTKQGYSELEAHIVNRLREQFSDFVDDESTLLSLSGILEIKQNKLKRIKDDKQAIIEQKNANIVANGKNALLKILEDINIQALQNQEDLRNYDKDQLEKKLKALQTKLNTMRREIKNIFERSAVDAEKFLTGLKVSIEKEIDNYIGFDVETKVHTEEGTYSYGFLGVMKGRYTQEITTYHANISDVITNLRQYISRCKELSNSEFEKIININTLKEEVKTTVIGAFELGDKDFNENDVLIPLEIVIKKIQIPQIEIEVSEFEPIIIDAFSGASVTNETIHELQLLENKALSKISERVKQEIDKCQQKVENLMSEQAATFVDNIIRLLTDNIETLRTQIDNKENAIRQYETLCNMIIEYKAAVKDMEL